MINIRMNNVDHSSKKLSPKITVIGVGGAGNNAVNNMISSNLNGVDFVACSTDAQALLGSLADHKVQLGAIVTEGLGAGAKPEIGRAAAEESLDDVMQYLEDANMAFITAGMGGGTGTVPGWAHGNINDIFTYNDKLYAVGPFKSAGGIPADHIAIWNGDNWCGLGSQFNNNINAAAFYHDTLYIGGAFSAISADTIRYIAKWSGGNFVDTCSMPVGIHESARGTGPRAVAH